MSQQFNSAALTAAARVPLPPSPPPQDPFLAVPLAMNPIHNNHNNTNNTRVILPEFWTKEPVAWFRHAEAQFWASNITSELAKYNHVLSKLPTDTLTDILDLLNELDLNPTSSTQYQQLKARLLTNFLPSKWTRARQIINHPPLGDQRPSSLMNKMLALLPPGDNPDTLFLTHFLDRLPQNIREHLAINTFNSPRDLAQHADQLWEARSTSNVSLASLSLSKDTNYQKRFRSPSPNKRFSSPFPRPRSPSPHNHKSNLCHFHQRFGTAARNCQPPCNWTSSTSSYCWYHTQFGARAQKCEDPCSWTPTTQQQQGNANAGGS